MGRHEAFDTRVQEGQHAYCFPMAQLHSCKATHNKTLRHGEGTVCTRAMVPPTIAVGGTLKRKAAFPMDAPPESGTFFRV